MYQLLSKNSKEALKEKGVFLYRFQIPEDEELGYIARRLLNEEKIHATFTSQTAITMVVPTPGATPVAIKSRADLQVFTTQDVSDFLSKKMDKVVNIN